MLFAPSAALSTNALTVGPMPSSTLPTPSSARTLYNLHPYTSASNPPTGADRGSFYAALARGRVDAQVLRELLVRHPLAGSAATTPVYAVDPSVWPRCDAEASPERGYYYHPSRHSSGQPIVAGWAYQWLAQLSFTRDSWTTPLDVRRVHPSENANVVAVEQITDLLNRLGGWRTAAVRLRCRLRLRQGAAGTGAMSLPDPPPLARRAPLLRRPESVRPAGEHRTPLSPRAEDEVR